MQSVEKCEIVRLLSCLFSTTGCVGFDSQPSGDLFVCYRRALGYPALCVHSLQMWLLACHQIKSGAGEGHTTISLNGGNLL